MTAWREAKTKLDVIENDGTVSHELEFLWIVLVINLVQFQVVHLTSLLSTYPKNPEFNFGSEPIELLVRNNTEVILYGRYYDPKDIQLNPKDVALKDLAAYVDQKIKVQGYVKTELAKFTTKESVFTSGSICDGIEYKIEAKSVIDHKLLTKIPKGFGVEVIGTVKKYGTYPPFIQFSSKADYKKMGSKKLEFQTTLNCYQNIK